MKKYKNLISHIVLIIIVGLIFYPLLFMVSTSFKSLGEILINVLNPVPKSPTLEGWIKLGQELPIITWLRNSILVSTIGTGINLFLVSLAAYAFARLEFPGRNILYGFIVSTLMLPLAVYLVPLYMVARKLKMIDSYIGMAIPVVESIFGVFLLTQFCKTIPIELEEAAMIDGASRLDIFFRIFFPLAKPGLVTLAIFTFVWKWNMFLWPLVIMNTKSKFTVPLGLSISAGHYVGDINMLMAGAFLTILPLIIIYIFMQRYIVGGAAISGFGGK